MAFPTGYLSDPNKVQGGESYNEAGVDIAATTFQDGLVVGRFAKVDSGSIDNMDSSATPNIAGVVLRNDVNAVESDGTLTAALNSQISFRREGLVSVDVVAGTTPPVFGTNIEASNAGNASDGLALLTGGIDTTAEFIEEITTDVWLVRLGAFEAA